MRFIRWQTIHMKCLVLFSLQNKGEIWMMSAWKIARCYKDIYSFIHINQTSFWADTYFSSSESWMQLENAYASKEWTDESVIHYMKAEASGWPSG